MPQCRYRADVAAYRRDPAGTGTTAVFECKQARADLRKDNCSGEITRERLRLVNRRRVTLEKNLRVHYPTLRTGDSLFPEYDSYDFAAIAHHGYNGVLRELTALQNRLHDGRKFETLVRYRCANLFFLVLPQDLFCESEVPPGWGALVESAGSLTLVRKPVWHDTRAETRLRFLERIATAGTRQFNRALGISREEIELAAASL